MSLSSHSRLLRLPVDIIRIILEALSEEDQDGFHAFRLVSKACSKESDFLFWKKITIQDGDNTEKGIIAGIIKRIIDPSDVVTELIRHIHFGPFSDEEWFDTVLVPSIQPTIKAIKHLQSLTWNTPFLVPSSALEALHKQHPSVELRVILHERKFRPLDRNILSSPQLHTLDISIYWAHLVYDFNEPFHERTNHNEYHFVSGCIRQSTRLRHLRIRLERVDGVPPGPIEENFDILAPNPLQIVQTWESFRPGPLAFDWKEGDRMGPLEVLDLSMDEYALSPQNCEMWTQVTSWEHLRRLEFDYGAPRHFFVALTNRVVNLKALKFFVNVAHTDPWIWEPFEECLGILAAFLDSIVELHEVDFGAFRIREFSETTKVLLMHTKGSLRSLQLICHVDSQRGWTWTPKKIIKELARHPRLEYLNTDIAENTVVGTWSGTQIALDARAKFEMTQRDMWSLEYFGIEDECSDSEWEGLANASEVEGEE